MCEFLSELKNRNNDTNFKWLNRIKKILEDTSMLNSWQSNFINTRLLKDKYNDNFLEKNGKKK